MSRVCLYLSSKLSRSRVNLSLQTRQLERRLGHQDSRSLMTQRNRVTKWRIPFWKNHQFEGPACMNGRLHHHLYCALYLTQRSIVYCAPNDGSSECLTDDNTNLGMKYHIQSVVWNTTLYCYRDYTNICCNVHLLMYLGVKLYLTWLNHTLSATYL